MVTKSSWPFLISITLFNLILSFVAKVNLATSDSFLDKFILQYSIYFNFAILLFLVSRWFRDIIIEATFEGRHTLAVQRGIILGFLLFLLSEIMVFFIFIVSLGFSIKKVAYGNIDTLRVELKTF